MKKKSILLAFFVLLFLPVITAAKPEGYGAQVYGECVYGDSTILCAPLFILIVIFPEDGGVYRNSTLELNVTASPNPFNFWYILNGGAIVIFSPNTTINASQGHNVLTVFANDTSNNIVSETIEFDVRLKTFLMEVFLTFEIIGFAVFYYGIRYRLVIPFIICMLIFAPLAASVFAEESLIGDTPFADLPTALINFGMFLISLVYMFMAYLQDVESVVRKQKERE